MRRIKAAAALLVVAALAWGGWQWTRRGRDGRDREMRWVEATVGPIEDTFEATGSVVALNRITVQPPIGGRVEELLVEEGAQARAGQIIAWMSSSDRAAILDAARARGPEELKRWTEAYKPTPIVAPLSGNVILRNVVVGETVSPSTVLYALADTLIVLAQVDESDIGRVKAGMPAFIVLDAYSSQKVEGKVFDVLYEGKNVSSVITYGVKVKPDQVPPFFRSQMTANVTFVIGRKKDAVLVPMGALQEGGGGGRQVLVAGSEGKPEPRPVTTGLELGDKVEIVSGLEPGEKVLLSRGRYRPQEGPQSSPLGLGGRGRPGESSSSREAPRRRNRSQ